MIETQLDNPRIAYDACPLCESNEIAAAGSVRCTHHPLYRPELGDEIGWMTCANCEHVFTSGWFRPEVERVLFANGLPHQTPATDPAELERSRKIAAEIVAKVANLRRSLEGRWLDVGFGNGALLTTAAEFGFATTGLDRRRNCVDGLAKFGYDVRAEDLSEHEPAAPYEVISFGDVLEHVPFPRATLRRAVQLLAPDGVLFLSMPNRSSHVWRVLDERGENPYWSELEHYHNFSREGLYALCVTEGLQPFHFGVSQRYRACMEVCCQHAAAQSGPAESFA